ncbi:MAG: hypothetical protein LBF93_09885 [Zoogloeaceae bacterium]|jgi:CRISPR-associated protein Cmr1|nr:hypothetical protein [Zoogloeaceae bacterium]
MKTRTFTFRFTNPAFLGNAEQNGAWRTPPIKALLRQWWRVAYAAQRNFQVDVERMRREEAMLFGHADTDGANRSLVRLRLNRWDEGTLKTWNALDKIKHLEVPVSVDAGLYLGYGPVTLPKGIKGAQPKLNKANAVIQADESASFRLAYPQEHASLLEQALWLMDHFGTLGGRSRNGWGSFSLTPEAGEALHGKLPLRDWQDCLQLDWPHAIGKDRQGVLIWQTRPQADWKKVMVELAKLKIGLRTQLTFTTGKNAPKTEERHWLSYPVTNHSVAAWGGNLRLPNSLRFKVRPAENDQFVGVIFHAPCKPPSAFKPDLDAIKKVWQQVHQFLDNPKNGLSRIQE